MSLHRFIIPEVTAEQVSARLVGDPLQHARVRRLRYGERVEIGNGRGLVRLGTVVAMTPQAADIQLAPGALPSRESPLDLTLGLAWLKGDALEDVVQKASELGVTRLWLFSSARTLAVGTSNRCDRLKRIAHAAAQQCGRATVMGVEDTGTIANVIRPHPGRLGLFFSEQRVQPQAARDPHQSRVPEELLAVVGPEGGFSEHEHDLARVAGFAVLTLGPRIMRAPTAAVIAAAFCQIYWGDLRSGHLTP